MREGVCVCERVGMVEDEGACMCVRRRAYMCKREGLSQHKNEKYHFSVLKATESWDCG